MSATSQTQWLLLKQQLQYAGDNSPYYRRIFKERSIDIQNINSIDDFQNIPITTKDDLQRFNDEFISIHPDKIIDYVTTSGTLGSPVNFALNETDLQRLAENEYRSFKLAGVKKHHKIQITTTLDRRFMAGLAYFLGLRKLGAGIIRTGSGLPELQWDSIERFKPDYLVAVPSFLLKMIEYARDNNIDFKGSSIKAAICIGEPLRNQDFELNALGQKIIREWDIELFSTYASTEMATAFTECEFHKGNHVSKDLIYIEVIDEKGKHVEPGEMGELVVTPLKTETMPLLRFATGDMLTYYDSICDCGSKSLRLGPVIGRKQQKLKLKGTSLYPQHILEAINAFGKLGSFLIEADKNDLNTDILKVFVPDDTPEITIIEFKDFLKSHLQVTPQIEVKPVSEIEKLKFPRTSRKPQLFRDLR